MDRAIQTQHNALRRERSRGLRGWLTKFTEEVALVIASMMNHDFTVGIVWLRHPARKGRPIPLHVTTAELEEELQRRFLACDTDRIESCVDPQNSDLPDSVIGTAQVFVSRFKMAELVWRRNSRHGAVASKDDLIVEWNRVRDDLPGFQTLPPYVDSNRAKKCLQRFRKSMMCDMDTLKTTHKPIPLHELRTKAPRTPLNSHHDKGKPRL